MVKKHILHIAIFIALLVTSCTGGTSVISTERLEYSEYLRFAQIGDDITIVEIVNPWDTARMLHRYILVPKNRQGADVSPENRHSSLLQNSNSRQLPENLPKGTVIYTPIDSIIVYSSVHASIIEELGATENIIGVCEAEYIVSPELQKKIREGEITDCGSTMSPNIERIIQSGAQVIIASPFENSGYGAVEKLGLPIIEGADYMENTPIGRHEWIRFFGALLDREDKADSIFRATRDNYNALKDKVAEHLNPTVTDKPARQSLSDTANAQTVSGTIQESIHSPTLIAERRYGASWDVPNSESYMVRMYEDAGARYIFDYLPGTGSTNMSFEKVFREGAQADYWIFKYWKESDEPMTLDDLKAEYELYSKFDAFRNGRVYACNSAVTSYYDDIMLHPDAVLKDFIAIFHPEILIGNPADTTDGASSLADITEDHTTSCKYVPQYFLPLGQSR